MAISPRTLLRRLLLSSRRLLFSGQPLILLLPGHIFNCVSLFDLFSSFFSTLLLESSSSFSWYTAFLHSHCLDTLWSPMHRALQRRSLSLDADGHQFLKRLPQGGDEPAEGDEDSDSGVNMLPPGPITITVTRTIFSSTTLATSSSYGYPTRTSSNVGYGTVASSMSTVTTTSYVRPSSTILITTSSSVDSSQSSSLPTPRTPSVPTDVGGQGSGESNQGLGPVSGSSAPKKLHSGVLIGVVIACILLAFAIAVFVIRKRYIQRRKRLRKGWASSKMAHLSVAPEPKVPFSSDHRDSQGLPMLVKAERRSTSTLGNPETMPFAPPTSYGNDFPSPSSAAAAATSQSPIYGPATARTLDQPITTVVSTFITTLPDELAITVGESIRVLAEYDDGWALCLNTRGEQGMIPMECLDGGYSVVSESTFGNRGSGGNLRRVSSLQPSSDLVGRF